MHEREAANAKVGKHRYAFICPSSRFRRGFLACCTTVGLLLAHTVLGGSAKPGSDSAAFLQAAQHYFTGDIAGAEAALLALATGSRSAEVKLEARLFLAEVCSELDDISCINTNNGGLLELAKSISDPQASQKALVQIGPSILRALIAIPNHANQNVPNIIANLNHAPIEKFESGAYLLLQHSEFFYYVQDLDLENARKAVARLVARAVVLPPGDYMFPHYLVEIITDLAAVGDGARASVLAGNLDNFIRKSLLRNNPAHIKYLIITAQLGTNLGTSQALTDALARLDDAASQISNLKVSEAWADAELAQIAMERAELLFAKNDLPGARTALLNSPIEKQRRQIQESGKFSTYNQLTFAAVDLFLSRMTKQSIDSRWRPLLEKPLEWDVGPKLSAYFEIPRKFGLALTSERGSLLDIDKLLQEAAFESIREFEDSLFARTKAFPIPEFSSKIIIGLELINLSKRQKPLSPPEQDFVVRAIDVLQRSILHDRGDTLYMLSRIASENERRRAHTWLLLSERRSSLEIQGLVANAQAAWFKHAGNSSSPPDQKTISDLGKIRGALVDLGEQLANLTKSPIESGQSKAVELPGSASLAELLKPGEVIVTEAPFAGYAFKACIDSDGQLTLSTQQIDNSVLLDAKVLRDSFSATYGPSDVLDKQYPVQSAINVQRLIFGGLESCIANAKRVFYNPILDFAGIPVQALLTSAPPARGDGWDLSQAGWLLNKYEFSYVSSAEEFVAARTLARSAGAEYPFLGVGDPQLQSPVLNGKSGGELLASRGARTANGTLATLPNLPETGTELRKISSEMPGSVLLLANDATKARLLREPLGHFNTIEFATHGLITGDLKGITEPGLVLTPTLESPTEAFDDGFLSSTKIAALNLGAQLVVLSACNTANFEVDSFVGSIRGLTSALGEAGVPTVIASLWPVESKTSEVIVSDFYNQLRHGPDQSVAGALTEAMRGFLNSNKSAAYSHPRFWAPFVVYGDGGEAAKPLEKTSNRLITFSADAAPGELTSLVWDPQTHLAYDAGYGDWSGRRFSSLVQKRSASGQIEWEIKDPVIGTGPIAVSNSDLFASGYISAVDDNHTIPDVRAFDLNGHLRWRHEFDEGKSLTTVTGITSSPGGELWLLFESEKNVPAKDSRSHIKAIRLDQTGKITGSWLLDTQDHPVSFLRPQLAVGIGATYVFEPTTQQAGFEKIGDFGETLTCDVTDATNVYAVGEKGAGAFRLIGRLNDTVVLRAKRIGSNIFLAGSKNEKCESAGQPYFAEFQESKAAPADGNLNNAVKDLVVETGLYGGKFVDFNERSGQFVLAGSIENRTNEWIDTDSTKSNPATYNGLPYETNDAFLVAFHPADEPRAAQLHFIDAGADVFINGIALDGRNIVFAGSVGHHALWGRFLP